MPMTGMSTTWATSNTTRSAIGFSAGPAEAAVAAAERRAAAVRAHREPGQRVDRRDRVGARLLDRPRDRPDVAGGGA